LVFLIHTEYEKVLPRLAFDQTVACWKSNSC